MHYKFPEHDVLVRGGLWQAESVAGGLQEFALLHKTLQYPLEFSAFAATQAQFTDQLLESGAPIGLFFYLL
jgi:hypothetical protein